MRWAGLYVVSGGSLHEIPIQAGMGVSQRWIDQTEHRGVFRQLKDFNHTNRFYEFNFVTEYSDALFQLLFTKSNNVYNFNQFFTFFYELENGLTYELRGVVLSNQNLSIRRAEMITLQFDGMALGHTQKALPALPRVVHGAASKTHTSFSWNSPWMINDFILNVNIATAPARFDKNGEAHAHIVNSIDIGGNFMAYLDNTSVDLRDRSFNKTVTDLELTGDINISLPGCIITYEPNVNSDDELIIEEAQFKVYNLI